MSIHSALHIMCAAIPLGVTGGQIGFEKSRLDFNDPNKQINKEELEDKINFLMKENHEINYEFIDSKILENQPELVRTMSVKPPRIEGKLRFVKIGTVDFQPCGGTHVKSTNEIVADAYVEEEARVLDPTLLDKSLIDLLKHISDLFHQYIK